jgi:hypothetical protein
MHLLELDPPVVVCILHHVDLYTVALKTIPGYANSEYFYFSIGAERNY